MIRYLLDTDTASFLMKQYDPKLTQRFNQLSNNDWGLGHIGDHVW